MILCYIDPGSGSILLQVIMAAIVGGVAAFWNKLKGLFTGKKTMSPPPDNDSSTPD